MNILHQKKFRYGSVSVALTVAVIAAVILFNAIFTALSAKFQWYIDMTPEPRFTLSDKAKEYLSGVDSTHEITIMLCDDKDAWESNTTQLEVLKTALDISLNCDNVKIEYVDVFTNPSKVKEYKERTGKNINSQSVIIKSGTEVRVFSLPEFFKSDSNTGAVIGYNGEQIFVSSIMAVTKAESPLLCVVKNHGETTALEKNAAILALMYQIGFEVKDLNLATEEIPAECRLILVYDPQSDFIEVGPTSDISELDKLDKFLDKNNSMMVFFDAETPKLPNLEQFLNEWGISVARSGDSNYIIQDLDNSFTTNGYTNVASYVEFGTGADITKQLREDLHPKTVLFPYATALESSPLYDMVYDKNGGHHGAFNNGPYSRACYDVFTSSPKAVAIANGVRVKNATEDNPFSYMKLSCQTKPDAENGVIYHSFVLASASTDFASNSALETKYGNNAVLSYACNTMGSLVIPVSLDCKYYANMEITTITSRAANQYTVVLAVIPASLVFIAGICVMVRRKYR